MEDKIQTGSKPIPKFASFRPKVAELPSGSRSAPRDHNHSLSHKTSRHARWHLEEEEEDKRHKESPQATPARGDSDEKIFLIDRYGDENNLRYGSLHRWKLPTYRRAGHGNILGLSSWERIDGKSSSEKYVVVSSQSAHRPRDKSIFAKLGSLRELRIREQGLALDDKDADFISFDRRRGAKRKRSLEINPGELESSDTDEEDEDNHYRSINGQSKTSRPSDPDLEYSTSTEQQYVPREGNQKDLEHGESALSRAITDDPCNGEAWLSLINFEERRAEQQPHGHRHATADIKISLYTKGLKQVKDRHFGEMLTRGMMKEASIIWDPGRLSKKWEDILRQDPSSIGLWIDYLNFVQTTFFSFRFDDLRQPFAKCVGALPYMITAGPRDKSNQETCAYTLLRITSCMKEAGFNEQAVAIWQSLLEFNFCRPNIASAIGLEVDNKEIPIKGNFEDFWDCEAARIGEESAQGWNNSALSNGEPPNSRSDAAKPAVDAESLTRAWYDAERNHGNETMLPARTMDDVSQDDPYRVILFSDIEAFLVNFPPEGYNSLLNAFLAFCQLPPLPGHAHFWWSDPFIRNDGLQDISTSKSKPVQSPDLLKDSHSLEPNDKNGAQKADPFEMATHHYLVCDETLFANPQRWFSAFDSWTGASHYDRRSVETLWIRRTLRFLAEKRVCGDDLAEYFLAFELKYFPKTAKKTGKALLKKNPSSLRLYNAYALIESRLGNNAGAESVWTTAISMNSAQPDIVLLWKAWVWEELESRSPTKALARLLSFFGQGIRQELEAIENGSQDFAAVIDAQRSILARRDHFFSTKDYNQGALSIECLMLLTYLSSSSPLEAVLSIFNSNQILIPSILGSSSIFHEKLHQSLAKIFYHHITHTTSFQPSLFRSTLSKSIALFPKNTIFLSLFAWNEARFRIDDRVRSVVQDILSSRTGGAERDDKRETVLTHLFAVQAELNRAVSLGSNVYSIRSTFERAVRSESGNHSALLWKRYFLFEWERGELHKAKDVFYRAIRACPWVKELYLLPFRYLRDLMGWEELKGCYDTMVEKELRIHIPLDEAFEKLEQTHGKRK